MTSTRDPYPFPRLENDENFAGTQSSQKDPYSVPSHLAQKQEPYNRLYNTATLSSKRREVYSFDPQAPNDSLDFVLKTAYNQHREFLKDNAQTLVQPETLGMDHGRVLKNRTIHVPPPKPEQGHPLRITQYPRKEDINSIKNHIEGHHTQTTNRGYSRKPDGGFFTS